MKFSLHSVCCWLTPLCFKRNCTSATSQPRIYRF